MKPVAAIRCTHVVAQVSLGYYDAEGNLVGEETFPQLEGNPTVAKLFYPHAEQLATLITGCVEHAWAKLQAQGQVEAALAPGEHGADGRADLEASGVR